MSSCGDNSSRRPPSASSSSVHSVLGLPVPTYSFASCSTPRGQEQAFSPPQSTSRSGGAVQSAATKCKHDAVASLERTKNNDVDLDDIGGSQKKVLVPGQPQQQAPTSRGSRATRPKKSSVRSNVTGEPSTASRDLSPVLTVDGSDSSGTNPPPVATVLVAGSPTPIDIPHGMLGDSVERIKEFIAQKLGSAIHLFDLRIMVNGVPVELSSERPLSDYVSSLSSSGLPQYLLLLIRKVPIGGARSSEAQNWNKPVYEVVSFGIKLQTLRLYLTPFLESLPLLVFPIRRQLVPLTSPKTKNRAWPRRIATSSHHSVFRMRKRVRRRDAQGLLLPVSPPPLIRGSARPTTWTVPLTSPTPKNRARPPSPIHRGSHTRPLPRLGSSLRPPRDTTMLTVTYSRQCNCL